MGVRDGPRLFTELIKMRVVLTRHLTLSLTGEATAAVEVQVLHACGEDECTDITGEARAVLEVQVLHACGEDECTDVTGEANAAAEVQVVHAFGEDECADITCEGRKKKEMCEDGRGECGRTRIKRSEFIHINNQ